MQPIGRPSKYSSRHVNVGFVVLDHPRTSVAIGGDVARCIADHFLKCSLRPTVLRGHQKQALEWPLQFDRCAVRQLAELSNGRIDDHSQDLAIAHVLLVK